MRLAFALFNWFPYGGMQRDLVKVVQACRGRAEIGIYCLRWDGPHLEGIHTVEVPCRAFTATGRRAAFERFVATELRQRYDTIIGFNRMAGLDVYFGADNCFAWRALHQRGWWYRQTPRVRHYLRQEAAVFGPQSSTRILLLSALQRRQYEAVYHTPASRLIDLRPGISREHRAGADAPMQRARIRQSLGLGEQDLLVLQVGSSFNTKGVDRSLLALASLPAPLRARVHYLLLGQDQPAPWLRHAQQLGLNQVRIEPGRPDIPDCMQGADLLLHPSRHESAGLVILEAVVAGLPVLTTASCGYAEHVLAAGAGLVCDEPFVQTQLNDHLQTMLQADSTAWRANGIAYGQTQDLYDMPQQVATLLLDEAPHG
ncbi:MAG TPA: glycosyltransferase family 4 protein [Hyphomicrobiales bacterium]|nr:glycosyltransferase family 4 protein [Hyphomicrobiales bacterium]